MCNVENDRCKLSPNRAVGYVKYDKNIQFSITVTAMKVNIYVQKILIRSKVRNHVGLCMHVCEHVCVRVCIYM